MFNRRIGFCRNCCSNVVHVRAFESRLTYLLDRLTFGILGLFRIGPWQCVDCGRRRLTIDSRRAEVRGVSEDVEVSDEGAAIGNYLRTEQSLAHAADNSQRFSEKYRFGIVEKLLKGKTTFSQACSDLHVSELEIQIWIKDYLQFQLQKASGPTTNIVHVDNQTIGDPMTDDSINGLDPSIDDDGSGPVIESSAVKKAK